MVWTIALDSGLSKKKTCLYFVAGLLSIFLSSCSSTPPKKSDSGGFFGGDSAPSSHGRDFDKIPDAVPKPEPLSKTGNNTYQALGKTYHPLKSAKGYVAQGTASWYGKKFHGRRTSSGETYDMWAMTAAHPTLPLPTYVEVTNLDTAKTIVVKVNDRGPFLHGRIIDLSFAAAHKLGIANKGTGRVSVNALDSGNHLISDQDDSFELSGPITGSAGSLAGLELDDQVSGRYFVQIGVYAEISNAISMRDRLKREGHQLFPDSEQILKQQGQPFKVQVGPYGTIVNAQHAKSQLEQLLGQALFLITK